MGVFAHGEELQLLAAEHERGARPRATTESASEVSTGHSEDAVVVPAAREAAWPGQSGRANSRPAASRSAAIDSRTNTPSPAPAAPAAEEISTENRTITAMKSKPYTSQMNDADHSGPPGRLAEDRGRERPGDQSAEHQREARGTRECTTAFTTTKAPRDTGLVSTSMAVPLRVSEETMPP